MPRPGIPSLRRDLEFVKLWVAQTTSELGTQVSFLALPLAALFTLHAGALEVSLLRTFEVLPFVLFGLPAGVWVDRLRRRPLMIAADVGRAAAFASVPIVYAADALTLAQLYVVAFVVGTLTVVFDVSYLSFLPGLVKREQLGEANSKLLATQSAAQVAGPAFAGSLVGAVGAPVAVAADAASYGASGALVALIRRREPAREEEPRRRWREELVEGLPLAPKAFPIPVLVGGGVVGTGAGMLFNVNQLTYRQAITPPRLLGRMNSVVRFMYWGTIPVGSALGGVLATWIGLRPTLFVEAIAGVLVMLPVALSPLRRVDRLPEPVASRA